MKHDPSAADATVTSEPRPRGAATSANWTDPPHNRWGFLHIDEVSRTITIPRRGPTFALPSAPRDLGSLSFEHLGQTWSLADTFAPCFTDALAVYHDGALIYEHYADGVLAQDRHLLMSVSKSLTSLLCGVLVEEGHLTPGDRADHHVPGLAGTSWAGATVQDLLDMRVGIAWDYDTDEERMFDISDYRTGGKGDLPANTMEWIRTIPASGPHSGAFRYTSLATDVLALVLSSAAGRPFDELFGDRIWSRIGAEHDALLMTDAQGFPIAEGGFAMTLRDMLRLGILALGEGMLDGRQLVPDAWLRRLRTRDQDLIAAFAKSPYVDPAMPDQCYHDCWWVWDPTSGIYGGYGLNGQELLVHVPSRTVIARQSSWPAGADDTAGPLHDAVLVAIGEHLSA